MEAPTVPFGVVIAGRPVMTEFRAVGNNRAVAEVVAPLEVNDLVFFLLPHSPIPPGHGAVLYYAVPPFDVWDVLGAVGLSKPSAVFRTGWPTNESMAGCPVVQLGVAVEPEAIINNLNLQASGVEDRRFFAHKIALDLFKFMTSFSQGQSNGEVMVIPTNILDRWMTRFNDKYSRDPNFMMKTE